MESQARVHSRTGWQENETDRLFRAVKEANASGAPLRSVFESLSADLGRKPNSIRNYYYACLREQPGSDRRSPAFTAFTPEETHELLRAVLMARGRGQSVRACVMQLAGGSQSRMLRYQNKYRTILKHRPEMIAAVCDELRKEGLPCPAAAQAVPADPPVQAAPRIDQADTAFCDPDDAAAARLMAQPCVHYMLEGLKELLRRAAHTEKASELQQVIDRQKVQFDLRRLAWEKDFDECAAHLETLVRLMREQLSPAKDRPDAQAERSAAALTALNDAEDFLARQKQMVQ